MKDFDSLIFDLDGTLWDTCEACAVAWNNVATLFQATAHASQVSQSVPSKSKINESKSFIPNLL